MFLQRLITSLILIPLIILIIFYAPAWFLGLILLVILLGMVKESWQLIPLKGLGFQLVYGMLILLAVYCCYCVFSYWLIAGLMLWGLICIAILSFPQSQLYWGYPSIVAIVCLILMPLFIVSLSHLYYQTTGQQLLLYVLFLIWAADSGAYLSGKYCGKHKLIPKVSPGKSWEGVMGGFLLALVVAFVGGIYFQPISWLNWVLVAVGTIIIAIFGDLFISILKRRCHLKDTGNLIPGHGGILDRLDSLMAAIPLFYFGLIHGQ